MQVLLPLLLPPPEIKILSGNHIYSTLPKQTVNLAPPDLHASACKKNGGWLHSLSKGRHTGQTKHDFQNILGCVRLSDIVKTLILGLYFCLRPQHAEHFSILFENSICFRIRLFLTNVFSFFDKNV